MSVLTFGIMLLLPPPAAGADIAPNVSHRACSAIAARVDAVAGDSPALLRSYDGDGDGAAPAEPAQRTAAYTYDNALAAIALLACGRPAQAERIGEALRLTVLGEPRVRNAYRAGPPDGNKVLPNGWWDERGAHWAEDAYQQGSATGNVAWAGLALIALHRATGAPRWLEAARGCAAWIIDHAADPHGALGFTGGIEGDAVKTRPLAWKSTEHNIDVAALFEQLAQADPGGGWQRHARTARTFIAGQWDERSGHFLVGTLPDGVTPNRDTSALDVQLWPLLLSAPRPDWKRALRYAERAHGVAGGFDFNADRDGLWLEGTAQAALVYRLTGDARRARGLLATIDGQFATSGYVYATREASITTGLAIGSASTAADFRYYRLPHLAATAWAALAALRCNPFDPAVERVR